MPVVLLSIESDIANVPLIGVSMRGIAGLIFDSETAALVELCVVEAVTNVIKHGYGDEIGRPITVHVRTLETELIIEIADSGNRMPVGCLESYRNALEFDPDDLDSVLTSGMGLAIIQSVMDEVTYHQRDSKNVLSMTLRHRVAPASSNLQSEEVEKAQPSA